MVKLIVPNSDYKEELLKYKKNFSKRKNNIYGTNGLLELSDFDEWLKRVTIENLQKVGYDLIPCTVLMAIDENTNKLVGMVTIRHKLNYELFHNGGHIGYSVAKKERRKGYGSEILKQALKVCDELDLQRVLITCNKKNIGSRSVALKNGFVFFDELQNGREITQRFWREKNS